MVREIKGSIYVIRGSCRRNQFVECDNLKDLYYHIAEEWELKGYMVSSVTRLDPDGSSPRISVLTNKEYKEIKRLIVTSY